MSLSVHKARVVHAEPVVGRPCNKPYQRLRVEVYCDDPEIVELVTMLTDYGTNYQHGDALNVQRVMHELSHRNYVSYEIVAR